MGKVNKPKQSLARPLKVPTTGKINKVKQKFQKPTAHFSYKLTKNVLLENVNTASMKQGVTLKNVFPNEIVKSKKSGKQIIKKKDKINLKRVQLMKKLDKIDQLKREEKVKEKRKKISVIGDTNPLHDALPSLETILKNKEVNHMKQNKKKRGIEKSKQRKKKLASDMDLFKKAINDKTFKSNPFEIISNHVEAVVERERSKVK